MGVIFSPRTTYSAVARRPRAMGVLVLVFSVMALATGTLLSTEVGRGAYVDQALTMMEGFGIQVNDDAMARLEAQAPYAAYTAVGSQIVTLPVVAAIVAGLSLGVFVALLGADGTFRQAFAVVAHSYVILALQALFSAPLNYARETLASTTSLLVFLPMLDDASFAGRLLGSIDLFRIWWLVSLAVGFGVLYKRRTSPIAGALLALYVVFIIVIAGARTALSGA
jgi:hypothetical protein